MGFPPAQALRDWTLVMHCPAVFPPRSAGTYRYDTASDARHIVCRLGVGIAMPSYPTHPRHPERVCCGCDQYCPADDLTCGKDTVRSPHPVELFGEDWQQAAEGPVSVDEMTRARVIEALRGVLDPKVGINIVDLGVLHEVQVSGSAVRISLTLTSPSGPLGEQIRLETAQRVSALKDVKDVIVTAIWDPLWTRERMSPAARAALGS
jgi:metal-sulfur cluster biosynthetic enzyme